MMSFFDVLLGYNLRMSCKDNHDLRYKSQTEDENVVAFCNLIKRLKV